MPFVISIRGRSGASPRPIACTGNIDESRRGAAPTDDVHYVMDDHFIVTAKVTRDNQAV
ncbi:MAG: hypothetical protein ACXWTK_05150 [Methylobacter sp.]